VTSDGIRMDGGGLTNTLDVICAHNKSTEDVMEFFGLVCVCVYV